MLLWTEGLAAVVCMVYACFFEWVLHRHFMHAPRFPLQDGFRGHMEHHQRFRADSRFEALDDDHADGIALRWYAFPLIILAHLPLFFFVEWATGYPTVWGATAGCALYFAGYEYTHFAMHAPRQRWFEKFGWFRFMRDHHRLHHEKMRCNYNVFVPLADLCLGTLVTERSLGQKARR